MLMYDVSVEGTHSGWNYQVSSNPLRSALEGLSVEYGVHVDNFVIEIINDEITNEVYRVKLDRHTIAIVTLSG